MKEEVLRGKKRREIKGKMMTCMVEVETQAHPVLSKKSFDLIEKEN